VTCGSSCRRTWDEECAPADCDEQEEQDDQDDQDGDGVPSSEDCDDQDPDVGAPQPWYPDRDGDGYGALEAEEICEVTEEYVSVSGDTDDENPFVYPGAAELCDGVQNDSDASAWTLDEEAGMATFFSSDGVAEDLAADLSGQVTLATSGTLHICAGTWSVSFVVTADSLSILGAGADATILQGSDGSVIAAVGVDSLVLEALSVTSGEADNGGGLYLESSSATIHDVTISNNSVEYAGGGVYLKDSSATLSGVTISDNVADYSEYSAGIAYNFGGGVYAAGSELVFNDVTLSGNTCTYGGGMYTEDSTVTMSGATVSGNVDDGLDLSGTATIEDSTISGNDGSGLLIENYATLIIRDSVISDNHASRNGGAIWADSTALTGAECSFVDNSPQDVWLDGPSASYELGESVESFSCDENACSQ
jgi:parallel beta-helix repeat protein